MVVVNPDGTLTVTGNLTLYNQDNGVETKNDTTTFNITADMKEKCANADKLNRKNYWYYLQDAELVSENDIPTS